MGAASHGLGTARTLQVREEAGAFSGLEMGLATLTMAVAMPLLAALFLEATKWPLRSAPHPASNLLAEFDRADRQAEVTGVPVPAPRSRR
jgi:LrgB-like family